MSRCTCIDPHHDPGNLNPDCPTHGLPDGVRYPPLDRHKRAGERLRDTEARLLRELNWGPLRKLPPFRPCPARGLSQR